MKTIKLVVTALMLLVLLVSLVSCSSSKEISSSNQDSQSKQESLVVLDRTKAIEQNIEASKGGRISLQVSDNVRVGVLFGHESLDKDATLVVAPIKKAPLEDGNLIAKGFSLEEKGTGKGPSLKLPAMLSFAIKGIVPKTASIVKYSENDTGYEVIPTTIVTKDGTTMLSAAVSGFSKYGVRSITPQAQRNAAKKQSAARKWVITVNDTYSLNNGPMKTKITLNFKATSVSGTIHGAYKGKASAKVQQDMTAAGGKASVPTVSQDNNVSFNVDAGDALAPLESQDQPSTSPEGPDWAATGNLNMFASGKADVTVPRYSGQSAINPEQAPVPFEINITGRNVVILVKHPVGTLAFDGTITQR